MSALRQVTVNGLQSNRKHLIDTHTIQEAKRKLIVDRSQVRQLAYQLEFEGVINIVKFLKEIH